MPSPEEYRDYVMEHCPKLYGRQVMMWLFNPAFRAAVQEGREEDIGVLISEELGYKPVSHGFSACDEWEQHLSK